MVSTKSTRKTKNGSIVWSYFAFGKEIYHRTRGPAVVTAIGSKEWWVHGKRHRSRDRPAVRHPNFLAWYQEGKLHRLAGPAIQYRDGSEEYYAEGKRHRIDGPAFRRVPSSEDECWLEEYWIMDRLHRAGGPARILHDGTQEWYVNGLLHRIDGPAVLSPSGDRWAFLGDLHRFGGPATRWEYFIFGEPMNACDYAQLSLNRSPPEMAVAYCSKNPAAYWKVKRYLEMTNEHKLLHILDAALRII